MGAQAEIRIPVVVDGDEIAKARIAGVKTAMEGLLGVVQRVNVELDAMDAKLARVRFPKREERRYDGSIPSAFRVGDVIAYLNDEGDGWNCWEVKAADERFLYDSADRSGDNIARDCAYLVKAGGLRV